MKAINQCNKLQQVSKIYAFPKQQGAGGFQTHDINLSVSIPSPQGLHWLHGDPRFEVISLPPFMNSGLILAGFSLKSEHMLQQ